METRTFFAGVGRSVAVVLMVMGSVVASAAQGSEHAGILILAHGGSASWNDRVNTLAASVGASQPVEVAFGMASRGAIQAAVDKLADRGVRTIVAVPLFVSSHSSVITSTRYLLGQQETMPKDLEIFAKMDHRMHGASAGHEGPQMPASTEDNTKPVVSRVPIRMTAALDHHALVADILMDRARAISAAPDREAVVLVAHGPSPEDENALWLSDMKQLADQMKPKTSFASIDWLTVRDDAPAPIRDAATAELRAVVERRAHDGRRVLIVPLLMSFGGIEQGIRKRLEGLDYVMATQGLMPDARLGEWIKAMAAEAVR